MFKFKEPINFDTETSEADMTLICDDLIYRNYVYNRIKFPEISVELWKSAYCEIEKMEKRYQEEIKK